ncbi:hypothetical protein PIB30_068791 [Stylosanthes scabra]|uniref:TF-B3 domain-containing protein n=1 Tax=Stylosanthes scabra TaxID=79078 RepID=A0ABU6UNL4_9FABA|nr:hypothetical protein [Stylosanthes scabra]
MSSPRSTIAIPIHASFLMFQNEFGNSFILNLKMEPDVGLIYGGFKKILAHHNINGGRIIIATYNGSCIFRFRIVECNEEDLLPYIISNPHYSHLQPQQKSRHINEISGCLSVNPFQTQSNENQSHQNLLSFPLASTKAKQPIEPDIQNDSCRHRRNARGNTTQISNKNRKAKTYESDQDSCLQTKRPKGWLCYLVAMVDGEYVVEKPVRNYHLTQYTMNVPRQLLEVGFTHDPKHIIVIDNSSKTYTVRVRNKSKKRKTMVLGRGWKKFQVANDLRKGDVIKMCFDPKYPYHLRCVVHRAQLF